MTKFRISNHNLKIETGRHSNIPVESRLCDDCTDKIEDEQHAMIDCKLYETERQDLYKLVENMSPSFKNLDKREKFIWLMATRHKEILTQIAKYLYNSTQLRKKRIQ